ncbi:MAG: thiamine-phosphate kinase [Verrucomicrobiota bacterium]
MFSTGNPDKQISNLSESEIIECIRAWLGPSNPGYPQGIGDDCAVLISEAEGKQIITTDAVTYGKHFDNQIASEAAGAKLIKRNLSDIAAMGGVPESAVLALLAGPDLSIDWLKGFFKGIRSECETYGIQLVGGDLSSLENGNFSAVLTLIGRATSPSLRKYAGERDFICVTGHLGGSRLGKHHNFKPRIQEGQWLAKREECTAMMDLTDGLSKDLKAIMPENCCALLDLDRIPISLDAHTLSRTTGSSSVELAFTDGEDYELLFCIASEVEFQKFKESWEEYFPQVPVSCIGRFQESSQAGRIIDTRTNESIPWTEGFEHFK